MAAPLHPSVFVPIGFGALILWRSYYRIRRLVGRQHLSKVRPWVTVTVFPLISVLLGSAALAHPLLLGWLGGGIALGTGLGIYGLRVTKFETTPQGLFYTPSAHIGVALSVLFLTVKVVGSLLSSRCSSSSRTVGLGLLRRGCVASNSLQYQLLTIQRNVMGEISGGGNLGGVRA